MKKSEIEAYRVVHEINHGKLNKTFVCVTEEPFRIRQFTFPSLFYEDSGTEVLNKTYDVKTCPDDSVSNSLGDVYAEIGAMEFLKFSKFHGKFLGIEQESLMAYLEEFHSAPEFSGFVMARKAVRIVKVGDLEILFPTVKLLDNQNVKKRE